MKAVKKITMKPGTLVVFEGLDGTGKTTQMNKLREHSDLIFEDPVPVFTHQPSGGTPVGKYVYQITEQAQILTGLGRQFLHLASHAEHYQAVILPALRQRAVFMDRCWWSTFAYSWFDRLENEAPNLGMGDWLNMIRLPTQGVMPDVVFYFREPHVEDDHNTEGVIAGYDHLAQRYGAVTVAVPREDPGFTMGFIFGELAERELATIEWEEED